VVTCEEIVKEEAILKIPNMTALPSYCVDAVVKVPYGSHPWSCYGYYYHDIIFQRDYAKNNETRLGFLKWIDEWVLGCGDQNEYCRKVGKERLSKLARMERTINRIPV
jgi:glutaconate CoA-transferase subunit A